MRIAALALVAGTILLGACSGPESVHNAKAKVDAFHRNLDKGDYEAIWQDTSQDLRGTATKESFSQLLSAVHTKLGNVKETKQTGWRANVNTGGSFAEVTMDTTFEKGSGQENFVFRNLDGEQKLAGYHINSTDMMLK